MIIYYIIIQCSKTPKAILWTDTITKKTKSIGFEDFKDIQLSFMLLVYK